MRYLKWAFLGLLAILLLTVALANRDPVLLRLLPDSMGSFLGMTGAIQVPLFVPVFGGIVAGLLIGFVWEWFREHKHRAAAVRAQRDKAVLEREVTRLRATEPARQDEVLALLDAPRRAG
jgi:uncharacterized integral membrane protein